MVNKVLFAHDSTEWITPKWLFNELNWKYGPLVLDAATTEDNPLRTQYFYTKKQDGLSKPWMNVTYCNPPYGRDVYKWVQKAHNEQQEGVASVMLLPARTDTKWFHDFIYKYGSNAEYRFLKGRLKFEGSDNSAPFPSMVVIFRIGGV